jgi:hypothetical protein
MTITTTHYGVQNDTVPIRRVHAMMIRMYPCTVVPVGRVCKDLFILGVKKSSLRHIDRWIQEEFTQA